MLALSERVAELHLAQASYRAQVDTLQSRCARHGPCPNPTQKQHSPRASQAFDRSALVATFPYRLASSCAPRGNSLQPRVGAGAVRHTGTLIDLCSALWGAKFALSRCAMVHALTPGHGFSFFPQPSGETSVM